MNASLNHTGSTPAGTKATSKDATCPTPGRLAIAVAFALATMAGQAEAAGLGRLSVQSALGQPLAAEVEVTSVTPEEASSLTARLASPEAFRGAGLQYTNALAGLRMAVEQRGGRYVIKVSSNTPINEPFVDLMVELNWASGKFVREYTFLLDPPELRQSRQTVESGTRGAPVAPAASARPTPGQAAGRADVAQSDPQTMTQPSMAQGGAGAAAAQRPSTSTRPVTEPTTAERRQPAPAAPRAPAAVSDTVVVGRGDTLGKIAESVKPANATIDQTIVAIYQANRSAFIQDNPNLIRQGRTLSIPNEATITSIDASTAQRQLRVAANDFRGYKERLGGAAAQVPGSTTGTTASGTLSARVEDGSARGSQSDRLELSRSTMPGGGQAGAVGSREAEAQVARNAAINESNNRIADLERSVSDLQKMLELKSKSLADLQSQLDTRRSAAPSASGTVAPGAAAGAGASNGSTSGATGSGAGASPSGSAPSAAAPSTTPSTTTPSATSSATAPSTAPSTTAPSASTPSASTTTPSAATPSAPAASSAAGSASTAPSTPSASSANGPSASSSPSASNGSSASGTPSASSSPSASTAPSAASGTGAAASSSDPARADAKSGATPIPPLAQAPTPVAAPAPAKAPVFEDDLFDGMLDNPVVLPALGGLALLGGFGLFLAMRRRKSQKFEDSLVAADAFTANSLFGTTGGTSVDTNTAIGSQTQVSTLGEASPTEVDPIAEADVYIAYGREAQAEEILKEALKRQPERQAIRLKLMEIYSGRKDAVAFESMAREMHDSTRGQNEEWSKVVAMGQALDPSNSLYAGDGPVTKTAGPATQTGLGAAAAAGMAAAAGVATAVGRDGDTTTVGPMTFTAGPATFTGGPATASGPATTTGPATKTETHAASTGDTIPDLDFDLDFGKPADTQTAEAAHQDSSQGGPLSAMPSVELPSLDLESPTFTSVPAGERKDRAADPVTMSGRGVHAAAGSEYASHSDAVETLPTRPGPVTDPEPDMDLSAIGLDLSPTTITGPSTITGAGSGQWQEMASKLDLASAYGEIGDKEGARELLQEVVRGGDPAQQQRARELLASI